MIRGRRETYVEYVGKIIEIDHDDWTSKWYVTETDRQVSHSECRDRMAAGARGMFRWFGRAMATVAGGDKDMTDGDLERLEWELDDIASWLEAARQALDARRGVQRQEERIKALREVTGRTPEEAAAFLAKADELEGRA